MVTESDQEDWLPLQAAIDQYRERPIDLVLEGDKAAISWFISPRTMVTMAVTLVRT